MPPRRFVGMLAAAACALGLVGAMCVTPGIAAGQSPSSRSCHAPAFTGRVGFAPPPLCHRPGPVVLRPAWTERAPRRPRPDRLRGSTRAERSRRLAGSTWCHGVYGTNRPHRHRRCYRIYGANRPHRHHRASRAERSRRLAGSTWCHGVYGTNRPHRHRRCYRIYGANRPHRHRRCYRIYGANRPHRRHRASRADWPGRIAGIRRVLCAHATGQ
jgi:hypothetical protein